MHERQLTAQPSPSMATSALLILLLQLVASVPSSAAFHIAKHRQDHAEPHLDLPQRHIGIQRRQPNLSIRMASTQSGADDESTMLSPVGQMYGGLIFLKTRDRPRLVDFYTGTLRCKVWLEQPNITIVSHGNLLLRLHHQPSADPDLHGMFTFVYPSEHMVDEIYEQLKELADDAPRINETYRIYQFFATDPDGRKLEFQAFLHPLSVVSSDPNHPANSCDKE